MVTMMAMVVKRLKSRPQFQAVLAGPVVGRTHHFALHCAPTQHASFGMMPLLFTPGFWLGAMVPKRWAKRAVTRNAIKRQIYQLGFRFREQFPEDVFLVRLRQEFSRKTYPSASSVALSEAVGQELLDLFRQGIQGTRTSQSIA